MTSPAGATSDDVEARGPFFDELERGQVFEVTPAVTLTAGGAAVHQAIVGDRLALTTDAHLGARVSGRGPLAHPAYVWDVAVGQSTTATHFVRANLFYRGLVFRRFPVLGDTLSTRTEVVGLRQNTTRAGRPRTGLAALRITTRDQSGAAVIDFHRCAMLPLGPDVTDTGHADNLSSLGADVAPVSTALAGLDLEALTGVPLPSLPPVGQVVTVVGGDVVSSAPELARLTLNVAQVHHDAAAAGGQRLVYGGHTIGIAASQACRAFPGILTFLGWASCDHTGPVHEGDTLRSTVSIERARPWEAGRHVVDLRSLVTAEPQGGGERNAVLDWRYSVLM